MAAAEWPARRGHLWDRAGHPMGAIQCEPAREAQPRGSGHRLIARRLRGSERGHGGDEGRHDDERGHAMRRPALAGTAAGCAGCLVADSRWASEAPSRPSHRVSRTGRGLWSRQLNEY
jgi:hypothetical protein